MDIDIEHASEIAPDLLVVAQAAANLLKTSHGVEPLMPQAHHSIVVARDKEAKVVGFVTWKFYEGAAYIGQAFVVPEHRRQGIYALMLRSLRERAALKSIKSVKACVAGTNKDSMEVHRRLMGNALRCEFEVPSGR
jgi:L-amino acid N-acyltransferase YncA